MDYVNSQGNVKAGTTVFAGVYINAKFAINSHCSYKKNLAIKSLYVWAASTCPNRRSCQGLPFDDLTVSGKSYFSIYLVVYCRIRIC